MRAASRGSDEGIVGLASLVEANDGVVLVDADGEAGRAGAGEGLARRLLPKALQIHLI